MRPFRTLEVAAAINPLAFAGALALLLAAGLAASAVPALRAARLDPVDALRLD